MSEKLIIGKPQYECPVCGTEWYGYDLFHLKFEGCPSCATKFDLELYLHEDEPLYTNWREKCYFRLQQEYDRNSDGEKLVQEYEAMFNKLPEDDQNNL
jgi:hypothetical protein